MTKAYKPQISRYRYARFSLCWKFGRIIQSMEQLAFQADSYMLLSNVNWTVVHRQIANAVSMCSLFNLLRKERFRIKASSVPYFTQNVNRTNHTLFQRLQFADEERIIVHFRKSSAGFEQFKHDPINLDNNINFTKIQKQWLWDSCDINTSLLNIIGVQDGLS